MRRVLTTFDVTCIGVNAIVGSGIYLFPGKLQAALGPASILAWVATGALCLPLALSFAELGSLEARSGASFRYAQVAFGPAVGFLVGWSAWVTSLLSWAAVASGIPPYLAAFAPGIDQGAAARTVSAAAIVGLGALNFVGVRPGARLTDALTIGKLIPLVIFIGAGLFAWRGDAFHPFSPAQGFSALPALLLVTMFAYQGFEVVGVPAGEVRDPQRSVPRGVIASVLIAALLYALIQIVFVGVGGRATSAPLPDAARIFLGPFGAGLLALGGVISMLGFNAGTALCTPRYLQALAEERLVPAALARSHPRFETPGLAIAASTLVAAALALVLDFDKLVDLAVLAVLGQYVATSAALVRLGRTLRNKLLGLASIVISVGFGLQCTLEQVAVLAAVMAIGVVVALATRSKGQGSLG
jgi:basic amino acid/polyamine antiporter, APA family